MNLLQEINTILTGLGLPVETGVFSGEAPSEYVVLVPLVNLFGLHADDRPGIDIQEVRISLYTQSNYLARADQVTRAILNAGIRVTARTYVDYEQDTKYHHASIDAKNEYIWKE